MTVTEYSEVFSAEAGGPDSRHLGQWRGTLSSPPRGLQDPESQIHGRLIPHIVIVDQVIAAGSRRLGNLLPLNPVGGPHPGG